MIRAKTILVGITLLLTISGITAIQTKVTIFSESLCPDCLRFINEQLYPAYEKLGDSILVEMVSYGFGTQRKDANGNWKFTCQHGQNECIGNKYEACALDQKNEQKFEMRFIKCLASSGKPYAENIVKKCAIENNYDWPTISSCFEGNRGSELLAALGDKTKAFQPEIVEVPTIVFNDVFDQRKQDRSIFDFLGAACSEIPEPKPEVCQ